VSDVNIIKVDNPYHVDCPVCRKDDGYPNVRSHRCATHRV
jgi:hypothetical protein